MVKLCLKPGQSWLLMSKILGFIYYEPDSYSVISDNDAFNVKCTTLPAGRFYD